MRVLLHEGARLTLRADADVPLQVRGLPGGTRPLRRFSSNRRS